MSAIPPQVSVDGLVWTFHRAGADPVPIRVTDNGVEADMTSFDVRFAVRDPSSGNVVLEKVLDMDPNNVLGRMVTVTVDDIAAIPARGGDFYVYNNTTGGAPLLEGRVFKR